MFFNLTSSKCKVLTIFTSFPDNGVNCKVRFRQKIINIPEVPWLLVEGWKALKLSNKSIRSKLMSVCFSQTNDFTIIFHGKSSSEDHFQLILFQTLLFRGVHFNPIGDQINNVWSFMVKTYLLTNHKTWNINGRWKWTFFLISDYRGLKISHRT